MLFIARPLLDFDASFEVYFVEPNESLFSSALSKEPGLLVIADASIVGRPNRGRNA